MPVELEIPRFAGDSSWKVWSGKLRIHRFGSYILKSCIIIDITSIEITVTLHQLDYEFINTLQGVVTYMLPVEAFATAINLFDWQKVCLIASSLPSEALDHLIFKSHRSNCSRTFLIL